MSKKGTMTCGISAVRIHKEVRGDRLIRRLRLEVGCKDYQKQGMSRAELKWLFRSLGFNIFEPKDEIQEEIFGMSLLSERVRDILSQQGMCCVVITHHRWGKVSGHVIVTTGHGRFFYDNNHFKKRRRITYWKGAKVEHIFCAKGWTVEEDFVNG